MRRTPALILAALLAAAPAAAQDGRRALTPADFDQWKSIRGDAISHDGRWAAYSLVPQVGDGEVVARSTQGGTEHRHTRGYIGRPQTRAGARGPEAGFSAPPPRFTADSRFLVFTIEASRAEHEQARRSRGRRAGAGGGGGGGGSGGGGDAPKASLGVMDLSTGNVNVVPKVKSFRLPEENGRWLAYLLEPDSAAPKPAGGDSAAAAAGGNPAAPAAAATPGGQARPVAADTTKPGGAKKKEYGSTLVLRDLQTGAETRIDDVMAYSFDEGGRWLAYTVSSRTAEKDGAYARSLTAGATHALLTGEGNYKGLAFDEAGTQLAFVTDRDERSREQPRYALYRATLVGSNVRAQKLVDADRVGGGRVIADKSSLRFAEDGRTLAFGVGPAPLDSIPADSLAEKAVFDLWHWRDARLQPQQRVEAGEDRDRSATAVYHLANNRHVVLGNDSLQRVELSEDMKTAMASTNLPYAVSAMWGEGGSDVYVLDPATGARRLVRERVPFGAQLSAGGRFVVFFDRDRNWHAYEIASGRTANLTAGLGVRFDQETWDTPGQPAPWGVAGWTEGDRSLLVYDRYDVWEMDPTGRRAPRVVTDSVGRRGRLIFRVVDLDDEEEAIDPADPLLFRVLDDETKASGYWRDRLGTEAAPVRLVMEDRLFGMPSKARDAEVYTFTRSTVRDFPDLWASGPDFASAQRLSEANPQQSRYRWPTVELVRWRSDDGVELKGLLYKPDDFDPTRRYPMVVYFYEQLSDNLHAYVTPAGRNVINPTVYASNGYLVFEPDIHYTEGYPGASALKSIVPGVQALINRGIVDPAAVGIQGQSWGGYQAAYMITRTPMFRAAMAGAPVANMTSAYGGIRWQSGLARAFQYERGQSRIGGSLWEQPMRYIENSPLFSADRITTPLLIMHNDGDGAVPWYQGIEMFVAMRRLGKEVYLVNYNGDEHNPTKRANQLDISIRMMQFFDHHLRGRPAPDWMVRGVPFLQKGRDQVLPPPPEVPVPQPQQPQTVQTGATAAPEQ